MSKYKTIVFDLDGTLADLSVGIARAEGYEDSVLWYMDHVDEHGGLIYVQAIEKHIDNGIFAELPVMPYHQKMKGNMIALKENGYNLQILTSAMNYDFSPKIAEQKRYWVEKNFPNLFTREQVNIVTNSSHKIEHITDDMLLIDDYVKIQKQFIEAGKGDQFIRYMNYNQTMKELNQKIGVFL